MFDWILLGIVSYDQHRFDVKFFIKFFGLFGFMHRQTVMEDCYPLPVTQWLTEFPKKCMVIFLKNRFVEDTEHVQSIVVGYTQSSFTRGHVYKLTDYVLTSVAPSSLLEVFRWKDCFIQVEASKFLHLDDFKFPKNVVTFKKSLHQLTISICRMHF